MGEPASAEDAYAWGMVTEVSADAVGRGTERRSLSPPDPQRRWDSAGG